MSINRIRRASLLIAIDLLRPPLGQYFCRSLDDKLVGIRIYIALGEDESAWHKFRETCAYGADAQSGYREWEKDGDTVKRIMWVEMSGVCVWRRSSLKLWTKGKGRVMRGAVRPRFLAIRSRIAESEKEANGKRERETRRIDDSSQIRIPRGTVRRITHGHIIT